MRKRGDEGFSQGNPEDADIEKASHNGPKEEGKDVDESGIHLPPIFLSCHGEATEGPAFPL